MKLEDKIVRENLSGNVERGLITLISGVVGHVWNGEVGEVIEIGDFGDDKKIYAKKLEEETFSTGSGYGWIPHGITGAFVPLFQMGYVNDLWATYSHYFNGTHLHWYWTGSGSYSVRTLIFYAQ